MRDGANRTAIACVLDSTTFYGLTMQATALEKAELHLTAAQAIRTLFSLYLRAHGTSPDEHPFAKEEVRPVEQQPTLCTHKTFVSRSY